MTRKITAPAIVARKGGAKIKMVTAYDEPSARIADRAGADIILVGDSVANVVLGRSDCKLDRGSRCSQSVSVHGQETLDCCSRKISHEFLSRTPTVLIVRAL